MEKETDINLDKVQISKQVIAEIVLSSIKEINGVQLIGKTIGNRLFELLGKKDTPGIDIKVNDKDEVSLKIQVVVHYGMNIPDCARQVQEAVRSAIDRTLDVSLKDINVNVSGIARGES